MGLIYYIYRKYCCCFEMRYMYRYYPCSIIIELIDMTLKYSRTADFWDPNIYMQKYIAKRKHKNKHVCFWIRMKPYSFSITDTGGPYQITECHVCYDTWTVLAISGDTKCYYRAGTRCNWRLRYWEQEKWYWIRNVYVIIAWIAIRLRIIFTDTGTTISSVYYCISSNTVTKIHLY